MKKLFYVVLAVWSFSSLNAATFLDVDTTQSYPVELSFDQHNRIFVEEGSIRKAVFPPNVFDVQTEEESGQLFVSCKLLSPPKKPLTLSVVTGGGFVQDLEVTFKPKNTEVVVLREVSSSKKEESPLSQESQIIGLLEKVLSGRRPKGYATLDPETAPFYLKDKALKLSPKATYRAAEEEVSLFSLENQSKKPLEILEKDFLSLGKNWVYLESNQLKPKESTMLVVSKKVSHG